MRGREPWSEETAQQSELGNVDVGSTRSGAWNRQEGSQGFQGSCLGCKGKCKATQGRSDMQAQAGAGGPIKRDVRKSPGEALVGCGRLARSQ